MLEDMREGSEELPWNKERNQCILLEHIIGNYDGPGQVRIEYATEHEHLVVITPLEGEAFEANNGKVLSVLKDFMLGGQVCAYISQLD